MPLYQFTCAQGCTREAYEHVAADRGARTHVCEPHGESMAPVLSVGRGLTWFEEGRARTIHNLGHEPVTIRSHREHEAAMRTVGVTWATKGRGMRGSWI